MQLVCRLPWQLHGFTSRCSSEALGCLLVEIGMYFKFGFGDGLDAFVPEELGAIS
jgi:hypothetical protein